MTAEMTDRQVVVMDSSLAEYAGSEAWHGIAWRYDDEDISQFEYVPQEVDNRKVFERTLPSRYRDYTFDRLKVHDGNRQAAEAGQAMDPTRNLYLWGNAGNGKTHLAVATAQHAASSMRVAFWNTGTLFSTLRLAAVGNADWPDLTRPNLLVIDDIGKVKPTDFIFQELYRVLEERWSNERGTIFTANHRPSEAVRRLAEDTESQGALLSRFGSGLVLEVRGPDKRLGDVHRPPAPYKD